MKEKNQATRRNKLGYWRLLKKKAEVEAKIIKEQQSSGPIFAVARIMGIKDTYAVAVLILLLVVVLEPLSIGLTVATSAAWVGRKSPKKEEPKTVHPSHSNEDLVELTKKHNLTISQIVKITG
jgi:hypothetical protein